MSDVFWRTLQHEGFSGFYKGIFPNLLKVVPSASITYLVYETMKKSLSLDWSTLIFCLIAISIDMADYRVYDDDKEDTDWVGDKKCFTITRVLYLQNTEYMLF